METSASPKSVRISNKFLAANSGSVLTCKQCDKRVYEMEKIVADSSVYHKSCFKCSHCKRVLSLGNYTAAGGNKQLYCKPHFIELFRTKGNYEEGFGMEKKTRPPGCDTFEGLQPNAGSAAKPKSPSKWERSGGQSDIVNRRDDMDGSHSDLPPPSTTRDMLAKYTNAAAGEGQGTRSHEPVSSNELPEQGTTKALLAKFKEIQTGGGTNGKSPAAPKQPIKLIDDEVLDDRRSAAAPLSPRSPEQSRVTPEGSVAGPVSPQHDQMSPLASPTKHASVSSSKANGNGMMDQHSDSNRYINQYDNNEEEREEEEREEVHSSSVGYNDDANGAGLLMKKQEIHDISDEDEVEKDIESHHHHHDEGHHHHDEGHHHHDEGHHHHDEGHHHHDEGHHHHDEDLHHHDEGLHHHDEGQGYRELDQDHQQSSYDEPHYEQDDHAIGHHFSNEPIGHHHAADEGQLIDFGEDRHDDGRYAEGDESPRQSDSVSHELSNPQVRYSHTDYEERANASGDDGDDYEAAKVNQARRNTGEDEEEE